MVSMPPAFGDEAARASTGTCPCGLCRIAEQCEYVLAVTQALRYNALCTAPRARATFLSGLIMAIIKSQVERGSEQYRANADYNLSLVEELRERLALVRQGGGPEAIKRHKGRGKMLARERVEALLDPGSAFM